MTAKCRPIVGSQGLWEGTDLYPALTRGLDFSGLIRMTAPFSCLLRHTMGWGSILSRIITGYAEERWIWSEKTFIINSNYHVNLIQEGFWKRNWYVSPLTYVSTHIYVFLNIFRKNCCYLFDLSRYLTTAICHDIYYADCTPRLNL
jgi:hypothetical protein